MCPAAVHNAGPITIRYNSSNHLWAPIQKYVALCPTWGCRGYVSNPKIYVSHVVVYPLPWPLLVGGVRWSRLWSTSQLLRPSGQQCSHSGGVCPQIQGRQCGAYVGAVEEMMCVVCVDVTEGV